MDVTSTMLRRLADEVDANEGLIQNVDYRYDNDEVNRLTTITVEIVAKYGDFNNA